MSAGSHDRISRGGFADAAFCPEQGPGIIARRYKMMRRVWAEKEKSLETIAISRLFV